MVAGVHKTERLSGYFCMNLLGTLLTPIFLPIDFSPCHMVLRGSSQPRQNHKLLKSLNRFTDQTLRQLISKDHNESKDHAANGKEYTGGRVGEFRSYRVRGLHCPIKGTAKTHKDHHRADSYS